MSGDGNNSSQSVVNLLENLVELCRSDSLSEKGLREIIGVAPNNDPKIIDYAFFHDACRNKKVTEEILRYLLEYFPNAIRHADERGRLPLYNICSNKNVTLSMVHLLIDAFPESLCHEDNQGGLPLHYLCRNENMDEDCGLKILKLLITRCPESVRHAAEGGRLPLHIAAGWQSPEFCRILIEAYPGSERMTVGKGYLPFHLACALNTMAAAKYLYQLHPESINAAESDSYPPINFAIMGLKYRSNPKDGIEVVKFLVDCNPDALSSTGETPLHIAIAFRSKHITLHIIELLVDAFPDSVRQEDSKGFMPLHTLCYKKNLDDEAGLEILKLLVEKCPESVRHAAAGRILPIQLYSDGNLPIHIAAEKQSPEFCRVLIEAHPGSERMFNDGGALPFHRACLHGTVAAAEYLHQLYPESINVANNDGYYPIHHAITGAEYRSPEAAIEMVQFLLDCDPGVVLQMRNGKSPLYWVCFWATNEHSRKLNAHLKVLQMLYDAHPEAIESDEVASNVDRYCVEVQTFINTQLTYARQARDSTLMVTRDVNGELLLHKALRDNAKLGSIKLLVKVNPSAICTFESRGMIPLHIACQHHETPAIVEYLINLNKATLTTVDREGNTALHYACIGANHVIIALLLDKYGSMSVSKRNTHGQLPIELLLQNKNEVSDEESVKFTESIYRLLRVNPETLMHYDLGQTRSEDCLSQQNKKKRNIDEV